MSTMTILIVLVVLIVSLVAGAMATVVGGPEMGLPNKAEIKGKIKRTKGTVERRLGTR